MVDEKSTITLTTQRGKLGFSLRHGHGVNAVLHKFNRTLGRAKTVRKEYLAAVERPGVASGSPWVRRARRMQDQAWCSGVPQIDYVNAIRLG